MANTIVVLGASIHDALPIAEAWANTGHDLVYVAGPSTRLPAGLTVSAWLCTGAFTKLPHCEQDAIMMRMRHETKQANSTSNASR